MTQGTGFRRYPTRHGETGAAFTRGGAISMGAAVAVGAVYVVVLALSDGGTFRALVTLSVGAIIALFLFGMTPEGPPRAKFRYLNALVLTRAERRTADSWVHVAPTRAPRLALTLAVALAACLMLGTAVFAGLQAFGVVPILNESVGAGGPFLGMLFFLALGAITGWLAWLMIWRRVRAGSYGTRPSGVTLGAVGIAVRVPGRDIEIAWENITGVQPLLATVGRKQHVEMIQLSLTRGILASNTQMLAARGYTVPTDALYTALVWYFARPQMRWELGRVEGSRRLEGWREEALAAQ